MQMLDWFLIIFVLVVAFGTAWFFYVMMEKDDDGYQGDE
jgi:cytochrome bd-type quinol oxidase subunit 2